ncbi:hypothetical protein JOB18_007835 [Solea senegalensis]|uniref:Uncharacterized protein n=1 Tax=Solea senegalensis TaxID=28829 RepID=A0AAV6QS80_SOLSE|nr:hypothetical protein JOB18_007835 [Solea senegalensis]
MFHSCSGPNNQWAINQRDDGQLGFYNSGPYPHSWPQFRMPSPSSTVHHSPMQHPYGGAYTTAQSSAWCQPHNIWKINEPKPGRSGYREQLRRSIQRERAAVCSVNICLGVRAAFLQYKRKSGLVDAGEGDVKEGKQEIALA